MPARTLTPGSAALIKISEMAHHANKFHDEQAVEYFSAS
eukprot:COSAG04_NODE_26916_length_289_cov_0.773684_1_plen_38_part_01